MSEYTLYLKAYTAARMGFSLPETTCKREALAVALGVRDAKDAQQFCSEAHFDECMAQKLS